MRELSIKIVDTTLLPVLAACVLLIFSPQGLAQQKPDRPAPTQAEVRYGSHERNALDFWQAQSDNPTPLVIYIHGGGFRNGSKDSLSGVKIKQFLDSGISVAALNYRLLASDYLPAAHHDCRRAVQFLRVKSDEWHLDAERFGAFGGSAGAQICMYLAFHDEMANPASQSELKRQSTRLKCVATSGGQATMDFRWWIEHIPGYERPHRPATDYFGQLSDHDRDRVIREISALSLLTKDDPPIYMRYRMPPDAPEPKDPAQVRGWRVHHVNFGVALLRKAEEFGVPAYLDYPGADVTFTSDVDFFREQLLDTTRTETPAQ